MTVFRGNSTSLSYGVCAYSVEYATQCQFSIETTITTRAGNAVLRGQALTFQVDLCRPLLKTATAMNGSAIDDIGSGYLSMYSLSGSM